MDILLNELRFSLRQLRRNPAFAVVSILTLALGIGVNTAVFSVVSGVLLRPLPYAPEERIVTVWNTYEEGTLGLSEQELLEYRGLTEVFEGVAGYADGPANLTGDGPAVRLRAVFVNAEALSLLGVSPILGRHISADEDREGAESVVLLSHGLWERRFGGDPEIVGRQIALDGRERAVIGILPAGFRMPRGFTADPPDVVMPLALSATPDPRNLHYLPAVAKLRDGVSLTAARVALDAAAQRLKARLGTLPETFSATAVPVREDVVGDVRSTLLILWGAVGLVLLIACVNVANLLLARADARQEEMAVRHSLGAGPGRLLRQLATETLLLAVLGGGAGILLGWWGARALAALAPAGLPRFENVGLDARVAVFSLVATLGTAALAGAIPALRQLRERRTDALRGARGSTGSVVGLRTRRALVAGQVALTAMLAIGAGLLMRSFTELRNVYPGFDTSRTLSFALSAPREAYPDAPATRRFYDDLFLEMEGLPGVETIGGTTGLPLASMIGDWGVRIRGRGPDGLGERGPAPDWSVVTRGYFETMRIPVVQGRSFEARDRSGTGPVVVISERMASRHWPNGDALGSQLRMSTNIDTLWRTVVGIVGDIHHTGLDDEPRPAMYLPHSQFPSTEPDLVIGDLTLVVRTRGEPTTLTAAIRESVATLDELVPVSSTRTLEQVARASTAAERFQGVVFGSFAAIAMLLAISGLYGVTTYLVTRRTRELGVRLALGATPARVRRHVLAESLIMTGTGLAAGLLLALAFSRLLSGLLFGIGARDPLTFAVVPTLLFLTGLLSALGPAVRASRVDPMVSLRQE